MTDVRNSPSGKQVEVTDTPAGFAPSQARYVDYRDTGFNDLPQIPEDQQDGSAMFPFDSLQKAASSIQQTGEPSLILLYPGDTNDQARKDVDITPFVSMHIKGLNMAGQLGFAQVGVVSAVGVANVGLEDIELEALNCDPNASIVFLRGGGRYNNIVCQFLSFSGQSKANLLGVYAMQIVGAVVDWFVGGGAELANCTAPTMRLDGCVTVSGNLTVAAGGAPSHFTNCDTLAATVVDGASIIYLDTWTASNLPGFTTVTGGTQTVI